MPEAPAAVPQELSSRLAKTSQLPDVLKHAGMNWERVKKVDGALDNIPVIHVRGAKIEVDEQADAGKMRKATKMKAGETDTNLVDYVTDDQQLTVMLLEGQRLGIVSEQDFKDMDVKPLRFQKGTRPALELPPLNRFQKAEVVSLILNRLGEANPATTTQFLDEASKLMFDRQKVTLSTAGVFSNLTLLNALAAGGREELSKYIVEQGYQPYAMPFGESQDQRRILAKLVKEAYGEEGITKVMSGETPYFAKKGERGSVPEYSAVVDIHIAQAMTNAMIPPELHWQLASLEEEVKQAATPKERESLRHTITVRKQRIYAALLNAFGAEGYEKDGAIYGKLGFGVDAQNEILSMASIIKESARFKEAQDMTMFEANRFSLAQAASRISELPPDKLQGIVMALPIEQTVEALRERARADLLGEDVLEVAVRQQLSEYFLDVVKDAIDGQGGNSKSFPQDRQDLLRKLFLNTYDTERSLNRKAHTRFKNADAPTKVKIGTPEAINQGIKGLDLLFRRSVSEQAYDWDTYQQLVIEGAANAPVDVNGATLVQGEQKQAADNVAAEAVRLAAEAEAQRQQDLAAEKEAGRQQVLAEQNAAQEQAEYEARSVVESMQRPEPGGYGDELNKKIELGDVTAEEIREAQESVLKLPKFLRFNRIARFARMNTLSPEDRALYEDLQVAEKQAVLAEEARARLREEDERRQAALVSEA